MIQGRVCATLCNRENRALQYAVPANCLLIGALSLLLPVGPLSAAMMLDAFLLAMAAIGITGHAAVLIVPNIAIKVLLLLIMLFIGCVSIDTFHAHYIREAVGAVGEAEVIPQSPVSLWRSVVHTYPSLPLWIIAFILLIVIEIRLFFCAWYRIAFNHSDGESKMVERHPPSYAYCISHTAPTVCSVDELPSYDEAVRRSSGQKPCCSTAGAPTTTPLPRSALAPCSSTSKPPLPNNISSLSRKTQLLKTQVLRSSRPTLPSSGARRTTTTTTTATMTGHVKPHRSRSQRVVTIQIEQPENASQR